MIESIASQIVATIISAAILALIQFLYKKYRKLNEWYRISVLHVFNIAWGIFQVFLGLFWATNVIAKVLFFLFSTISFAGAAFMFVKLADTIQKFESFINKISNKDTDNSDNKS